MTYVFEDLGTYREWSQLCHRWKRPRGALPSISSLSKEQLTRKVVCVYSQNADKRDRDVGLVKPVGASTPKDGTYTWVSGVASLIPPKS